MALYTSPSRLAAGCIRKTLETRLTASEKAIITGLVLGKPDQLKVFFEVVPQGVEWPYVRITYLTGGSENTSQQWLYNLYMRVVVHSGKQEVAEEMRDAIYTALVDQDAVSPYTNVISYTPVEHTTPVFHNYEMAGKQSYIAGGVYRYRLQETEIL